MLNKEQKIEIIENAVKEYFNIQNVNLLMILKYLNIKGELGERCWRVLIDGEDLIVELYSGNRNGDIEFMVEIDANGVELSKQSENLVNEIYNILPQHLKQNQD